MTQNTIPKQIPTTKPPKTITLEEESKLLTYFLTYPTGKSISFFASRDLLFTLLMLDAGLRVGEVIQLMIEDLWYQKQCRNSVTIAAAISKGKTDRIIPLTNRVKVSIQAAFDNCWTPYTSLATNFCFFFDKPNNHITARQVQRIIKWASLASIGRAITPHVLRHTFATKLMQTTNIRVVQELLGHRNLSSTQVYTHPNHQDLTDAINGLDPVSKSVK